MVLSCPVVPQQKRIATKNSIARTVARWTPLTLAVLFIAILCQHFVVPWIQDLQDNIKEVIKGVQVAVLSERSELPVKKRVRLARWFPFLDNHLSDLHAVFADMAQKSAGQRKATAQDNLRVSQAPVWKQIWEQYKAAAARGTFSMLMPFFSTAVMIGAGVMLVRIRRIHQAEQTKIDERKKKTSEEYEQLQQRLVQMQQALALLLQARTNGNSLSNDRDKIGAIVEETRKSIQCLKEMVIHDSDEHTQSLTELEVLLNTLNHSLSSPYFDALPQGNEDPGNVESNGGSPRNVASIAEGGAESIGDVAGNAGNIENNDDVDGTAGNMESTGDECGENAGNIENGNDGRSNNSAGRLNEDESSDPVESSEDERNGCPTTAERIRKKSDDKGQQAAAPSLKSEKHPIDTTQWINHGRQNARGATGNDEETVSNDDGIENNVCTMETVLGDLFDGISETQKENAGDHRENPLQNSKIGTESKTELLADKPLTDANETKNNQ